MRRATGARATRRRDAKAKQAADEAASEAASEAAGAAAGEAAGEAAGAAAEEAAAVVARVRAEKAAVEKMFRLLYRESEGAASDAREAEEAALSRVRDEKGAAAKYSYRPQGGVHLGATWSSATWTNTQVTIEASACPEASASRACSLVCFTPR